MEHEELWDLDAAGLSQRERAVALYAERDPLSFATSTAADIARHSSTSEATVARTAQKLGFSGIKAMKQICAGRVGQTQSLDAAIRDQLANLPGKEGEGSPIGTAGAVLAASAELVLKLNESLHTPAFPEVLRAISEAPRIMIYGLGTGFHIAEYLSLGLERIGFEARPVTGSGHTMADTLLRLRSDDVVLVVSPRGIFPDVKNFLAQAISRAKTVALLSQVRAPEPLRQRVVQILFPPSGGSAASEQVCAWALADVIIAELARERPALAISVRNQVQVLRERLSPDEQLSDIGSDQ
ncbi:MurR/RpiR family transcriptional regulator [Nesterenkonia ebinurensis]|uniref:MurR/RpiR family transcriptional regulator n=1 Tax=Nesterenkonia ebinurensis TaxID=2608252 RepID=UPI00123D387D|nr:MurR/RpiR family transcriptional regulator [Nesterenkonia ebinurensis]